MTFFDREKRLAIGTVKHVQVPLLGCLCDCLHAPAVVSYRQQSRRRRKIPIPNVMMDALEVPKALAGFGIEREQSVCEEIVACTVGSIKIEYCRSCRDIDNAPPGIERHPRPVVRCAGAFPCFSRPTGVAEFSRMRDGMKSPSQTARLHIECTDVAGRRGIRLGVATPDNNQILINNPRAGKN